MSSSHQIRAGRKLCKALKSRGGQLFYKDLKKSLAIKHSVEKRIANKAYEDTPICAGTAAKLKGNRTTVDLSSQKTSVYNNAQKVSKFSGPSPKSCCSGYGCCKGSDCIPEKFFCLPFFNLQTPEHFKTTPIGVKDKDRFLFVDLAKFNPRNASPLHTA